MEATKERRLSRWSPAARVWNGVTQKAVVTPDDQKYVRPTLERYAFLPVNYIYALLPPEKQGYYPAFRKRISLLATEPSGLWLIKPDAQRHHERARCRPGVFGLSTTYVPKRFFHNLKASMTSALIAIGAREHGFTLITQERILSKAPPIPRSYPTRDPFRPNAVKIRHKLPAGRGEQMYTVYPDDEIFGLARNGKARFFYGPEDERGTNPPRLKNPKRATLERKISLALAMAEQEVAQTVYGLPADFFYPIILEEKADIEVGIKTVMRLTKNEGSPHIIFNWFPSYNADINADDYPKPDATWFCTTWRRAWKSDFRMDQF